MQFLEGEILLVDKPLHWTSFDVVNKLRYTIKKKLGLKKVKIGHAGTLDPLATGLLVLCTGKFTKRIEEFQAGIKEYTGKIVLGKATPSYDLETEYNQEAETKHITSELIDKVRKDFLGEQFQTPPIFSAKKIDGKTAYNLARQGKEVVIPPSLIVIYEFEVDISQFPEIAFRIVCSKGTYIRSIAHDFGLKLNSLGTLIELRRTQSGDFNVKNALSVEEWVERIEHT